MKKVCLVSLVVAGGAIFPSAVLADTGPECTIQAVEGVPTYGTAGEDIMWGGAGDDDMTGGNDTDIVEGGNGSNEIDYY